MDEPLLDASEIASSKARAIGVIGSSECLSLRCGALNVYASSDILNSVRHLSWLHVDEPTHGCER